MQSWLKTRTADCMTNAELKRPVVVDGRAGFWKGGDSFPSGHATTTFAVATAIGSPTLSLVDPQAFSSVAMYISTTTKVL